MTDYAIIKSVDDASRLANAMASSGYFQDAKSASQSLVKIMAGHELGFGAFASMAGVHIIQGKPAIGANLMAAAVKAKGKYNYRVNEMTDTKCVITFMERNGEKWENIGVSSFTIEDAQKAGTKNIDKYPRNMLFARAMSNGVKWYTPDIFMGAPVYTPEELGAETDEDGNVIDSIVVEQLQENVIDAEIEPETMTLERALKYKINKKPLEEWEPRDLEKLSLQRDFMKNEETKHAFDLVYKYRQIQQEELELNKQNIDDENGGK